MMRDTLKRAFWTTLLAWGAWLVLRWIGVPNTFAAIIPAAAIIVSHMWAGAWSLARAGADMVTPNSSDEKLQRLYEAALRAAIETEIALPRVYVSDTMRRWIFGAGRSKYNPAVCVSTELLKDGFGDALSVGLRSELAYAKMRAPLHGSFCTAGCTFTLCVFTSGAIG